MKKEIFIVDGVNACDYSGIIEKFMIENSSLYNGIYNSADVKDFLNREYSKNIINNELINGGEIFGIDAQIFFIVSKLNNQISAIIRGKIFEVDSLSSHKCLGFSDNSSQNTKIAVVDNICSNIPGCGTIILNEFELNVRNKVQFIMAKINTANINSINFFTKNGYVKSSEDYITVNKDGKENNQGHIYYK